MLTRFHAEASAMMESSLVCVFRLEYFAVLLFSLTCQPDALASSAVSPGDNSLL